jgi:hypothetical protein
MKSNSLNGSYHPFSFNIPNKKATPALLNKSSTIRAHNRSSTIRVLHQINVRFPNLLRITNLPQQHPVLHHLPPLSTLLLITPHFSLRGPRTHNIDANRGKIKGESAGQAIETSSSKGPHGDEPPMINMDWPLMGGMLIDVGKVTLSCD